MPQNSIKACRTGIEEAKSALIGKGLSQQELARKLEKSRSTVDNFFAGKPVRNDIFVSICEKLELNWRAIAGLTDLPDSVDVPNDKLPEPVEEVQDNRVDIDALVQEVREKIKSYIKERCGTMRVLDMTQSIGLDDIYTNVNILETITGRQRLKIEDLKEQLLQNSDAEELDRFGVYVAQKRVPGLDAVQRHSKLMVLGKPGAGKTTFLKYLAMQCIEKKFQKERFPIFITLKDFAEATKQPNILEYIAQQLSKCKVTDADVKAEQLLEQGKVLLLLDGLDEVWEEDTKRVLKQVQDFSYQFSTNQFVITCRIAAKEYTFQGFTEVEVADFNDDQIATFAQNWFRLKDPVKGERFIEKLNDWTLDKKREVRENFTRIIP
ncbi:MAG: NACHT domain-containing protein, partial [Scytonema sp. PMC 1069.18]|nr:NACHT domain-containing protein [Scytonema sp. PMC 1069.18]MEC4887526.1 NACHT domain-containing protein [Scytonema sp. PMC 1070.18]